LFLVNQFPAEHSLCEEVTVLPRQVMGGTAGGKKKRGTFAYPLLPWKSSKYKQHECVFLPQLSESKENFFRTALFCHLRLVWLYNILSSLTEKQTFYGNEIEHKFRILIFSTIFSETCFILRRIQ
jgi:hypothetical protein